MWIHANKLSVVTIVETWLHERIPDGIVAPMGYLEFRYDRPTRGGGVCIVVNTDLNPIRVYPDVIYQDIEIVFIDLLLTDSSCLRLATLYCSTRYSNNLQYVTRIVDCIRSMSNSVNNMVITGDFNRPGIRWLQWDSIECTTAIDRSFSDSMGEIGFTQVVTSPTRGRNYLSLVFTRTPHNICSVEIMPPFCNSDNPPHLPVNFSIAIPTRMPTGENKIKNYSAINYTWASDLIEQLLSVVPHTAHNLYDAFANAMQTIISSAPNRRLFKNRPPAWDLARLKNRAWRIYRNYPTCHNHNLYCDISRQYAEAVVIIQSEKLRDMCDSTNSMRFYQNSSIGRKTVLSALKRGDGALCTNNRERAQVLQDSFNTVYQRDEPIDFAKFLVNNSDNDEYEHIFDSSVILQCVRALRTRTATGPDEIPTVIIKNISNSMAVVLSFLFRAFFLQDWIPPVWQLAIIVPVFKGKGSASHADNYRPIAVTSCISKIYERCILRYLIAYLTTTHRIPPGQFGGLPGRSTTMQLVHCYDMWTRYHDTGAPFDIFFIDISKAYDSVLRSRLATCLCNIGIPHVVVRAIMRFFHNRRHRVRVGSSLSDVSYTSSGVVQGTVLSSFLFVIYTAPLGTIIRPIAVYAFIDDIKWTVDADWNNGAQNMISSVIDWLNMNGLSLSANKSQVMHCGHTNPGLSYFINAMLMDSCTDHNDLGITFSQNLKFTLHIENMIFKANRSLFAILTRYKGCDQQSLTLAYTTYVRPILEYASPVWSPTYSTMIEYVEKIQRTFTRKLVAPQRMAYADRCRQLSLHSLEWRRLYLDLCLMFTIISSIIYEPPLVCPISIRPPSCTRSHQRSIEVPFTRNNVRKQSFFLRTATLWNSLPAEIVTSPTLGSFKRKLKNFDLGRFCHCYPY